ncbi:MAG: hypothetical protein R6V06_01040 [Kiritimatiellia bacterium]
MILRKSAFVCAVAVFIIGVVSCSHIDDSKLTEKNLKAARRTAAWKKRRVIMNNDGNDSRRAKEKTREAFLASRTTPLIGSQVDAIMYCDGIWGTFTHVSPTADLRVGSDHGYKEWAVELVKDGGPDPLGSIVNFGRNNGIEVFWSLRMNDTHDSGDPTMMSPWKKSHPDCLVGNFKDRKKYKGGGRRWSAVDYSKKEVRERTAGWFDEVGARYAVDGFELDFFRHPIFFKGPLMGKTATDENRQQMTEVVRRIRAIADRHALRRGRPVLVSVRIQDSVDYCRDIGLDIERWLQEGLIDMMTVSGYFRLNNWKTSVELGHRYDIPVIAGLSESRVRKPKRAFKNKPEEYRGRAYAAWKEGVDAVYTFNLFNPESPVFREIGDPVSLATMSKIYTTGARDIRAANYWLAGGQKYLGRPLPLCNRARKILFGKTVSVPVNIWDDLSDTSTGMEAKAEFVLAGLNDAAKISVSVNGQDLVLDKRGEGKFFCQLPGCKLKLGENVFDLKVKDPALKSVILQDLIVRVGPMLSSGD